MSHIGREALSLLALGEHVDGMVPGHLADCDRCRRELHALRVVVYISRDAVCQPEPLEPSQPPPERVWAAIAREVRQEQANDVGPRRAWDG